jgi:hypothetical protein
MIRIHPWQNAEHTEAILFLWVSFGEHDARNIASTPRWIVSGRDAVVNYDLDHILGEYCSYRILSMSIFPISRNPKQISSSNLVARGKARSEKTREPATGQAVEEKERMVGEKDWK